MADAEAGAQTSGIFVSYITSAPGILKILEIILLFIAFACSIACCSGWFLWVILIVLIVVIIFFVFFAFNLVNKFTGVNWKKLVFIDSIIFAILLLLSMSFLAHAAKTHLDQGNRMPSSVYISLVCGVLAMIAFICDAVIHYRLMKAD